MKFVSKRKLEVLNEELTQHQEEISAQRDILIQKNAEI
jgi:hypothetical protein